MIVVNPRTQQIGFTLSERTTLEWDLDKPVRHFVISLHKAQNPGPNMPAGTLRFCFIEPDPNLAKKNTWQQAGALAGDILRSNTMKYDFTNATDGLNFDIRRERCWVIFELDPEINWMYAKDYPAITTKNEYIPYTVDGDYREGFNVNLRYVYLNDQGQLVVDPTPSQSGICRFILFGIVHRRPDQVHPINIAIEFYQDKDVVGEPINTIPLIVDPTVPEDGHEEFPPP